MSVEIIIKHSKKIEAQLRRLGANGKGLHELTTALESNIDSTLKNKIRFVASVRNAVIHDDEYELTPEILNNFVIASNEIVAVLQKIDTPSSASATNEVSTDKNAPKVTLWDTLNSVFESGKNGIRKAKDTTDVVGALALLAAGPVGWLTLGSNGSTNNEQPSESEYEDGNPFQWGKKWLG